MTVDGALCLYFATYQLLLPSTRALWISERLAEVARQEGCPAGNIASMPYQEPSLVFLVGTDIKYVDFRDAVDLLKKGGCAMAFVGQGYMPAFEARAKQENLNYRKVTTVEGFAYNGGRKVAIDVLRSEEPAR
jgi:hypothetical protein